ncbi:hypothetical protein E3O44_06850 [Cryobacterium algoricola]|uniref:Uncharacterized protein n=1 Tax=Cryobacterium algoricola TaxID=1259183 RepID=A0ABY2IE37_9MICO|nr:hypothetical protein [Cryobacterium algoricola]TFB86879.1 hypothetical protein E3O44_06850 [Cryobacterium algoricola]
MWSTVYIKVHRISTKGYPMVNPTTQLVIDISDISTDCIARLHRAIADVLAQPGNSSEALGWTHSVAVELINRLRAMDRPIQEAVLRREVENGGAASREEVYDIGGYAQDRQLKGFTRAVNTIVRDLVEEGQLPSHAPNPMEPLWEFGGATSKSALAFAMPADLVALFRDAFQSV